MDMFSRQTAGDDLDAQFFAHLSDNRSYPLLQRAFQHLVAILRDPDDVIDCGRQVGILALIFLVALAPDGLFLFRSHVIR